MTKKVWKWFWVWDFDKEEKWLNSMASQGWRLCAVGYAQYTFEPCEPNTETVRLELLSSGWGTIEGKDYVSFVESTGAVCVGHVLNWAYFRKTTAQGQFDLFSDIDSRIKHVNTILALIAPITLLCAVNLLNSLPNAQRLGYIPIGLMLALLLLCVYGIGRVLGIRSQLENERKLHE